MGKYVPAGSSGKMVEDEDKPLTPEQKKGLWWALFATLGVCALWIYFTIGPGTPLIDETARPRSAPLAIL